MPRYSYKCPTCEEIREVFHLISEVNSPSEETVKQITCQTDGVLMKQYFGDMSGGYKRMSGMEPEQRKEILKKRSHEHFEREIKERAHEKTKGNIDGMRHNKK